LRYPQVDTAFKADYQERKLRRLPMINLMRNRFLSAFITFHMILFVTSPAMAAMIPSQGSSQSAGQEIQKDMNKVQLALESKLVQEKLKAYGLTSDEVSAKLSSMTPQQVHMLAQASDDILAGGDGLGDVIAVLIIILLIVVILKLMNKQIILKMSGIDGVDLSTMSALC
jgi:predicted PurR-regulated permease PerM